jgi:hypothetical protein
VSLETMADPKIGVEILHFIKSKGSAKWDKRDDDRKPRHATKTRAKRSRQGSNLQSLDS